MRSDGCTPRPEAHLLLVPGHIVEAQSVLLREEPGDVAVCRGSVHIATLAVLGKLPQYCTPGRTVLLVQVRVVDRFLCVVMILKPNTEEELCFLQLGGAGTVLLARPRAGWHVGEHREASAVHQNGHRAGDDVVGICEDHIPCCHQRSKSAKQHPRSSCTPPGLDVRFASHRVDGVVRLVGDPLAHDDHLPEGVCVPQRFLKEAEVVMLGEDSQRDFLVVDLLENVLRGAMADEFHTFKTRVDKRIRIISDQK